MTRIFTEGFELGFRDVFDDYRGLLSSVGYTGNNGVGINPSGGFADVNIDGQDEVYVRFIAKPLTSATSRLRFLDDLGNIVAHITWRSSEQVEAFVNDISKATGTTILYSTKWYLMEVHFKFAETGGIIQVKVNDGMEIDWSGNTKPFSLAVHLSKVRWIAATLDDIAVNDTTNPGQNSSWPGYARVIGLLPNGDGDSSQFSGSDEDSIDNYQLVYEVDYDDDATYVESLTSGHTDLYTVDNFGLLPGDVIQRVWVSAVAREVSADGDSLQVGFKPLGGSATWTEHPITENYEHYKSDEYLTNPATSSAWTQADIDALQVGVRIP